MLPRSGLFCSVGGPGSAIWCATGRGLLSAPGHRLAAGRNLREEVAVEVLVELQRNAAAIAVEKNRHSPAAGRGR